MPRYSKEDKARSLENLRKWIKPGDTVYTILRHVSRSGMRREIGIMLLPKGKRGAAGPLHPNFAVACVLDRAMATKRRDGVKVDGCGMDMGFEVVYNLGCVLWPKGKIRKCVRCSGTGTSNRVENPDWRAAVDRDDPSAAALVERFISGPCPECNGKGKRRVSGGYLIRHEWI